MVCTAQCLAPTYVGDFHLQGATLRRQGLNRIGNMIVPNRNYQLFETWIMPILDAMLDEQQQHGVRWTPSKVRLFAHWHRASASGGQTGVADRL